MAQEEAAFRRRHSARPISRRRDLTRRMMGAMMAYSHAASMARRIAGASSAIAAIDFCQISPRQYRRPRARMVL